MSFVAQVSAGGRSRYPPSPAPNSDAASGLGRRVFLDTPQLLGNADTIGGYVAYFPRN